MKMEARGFRQKLRLLFRDWCFAQLVSFLKLISQFTSIEIFSNMNKALLKF